MSYPNRYNSNDKLVRLKQELQEAELELECAPESRKQSIQNRINNIKREIQRIESGEDD